MSERDGSVRVEGLAALIRSLKAAEQSVDELKAANQSASRIVLDAAESSAPRRTGALARSGRINKAARKASVMFGSARVPYANPIHWGWPARHIKAQPWVTTAAARTRDQWLGEYERDLQAILDTVKGR